VLSLHATDASLTSAGWHGYAVTQGVRAQEAVALFKRFYQRENLRAPVPNPTVSKRRKCAEEVVEQEHAMEEACGGHDR